jgi:sodium-dependent dicarboxylate transporter 2/3/5
MLPVATPPNAIVLGGGAVTARQMLRAGIILDLAGVLIVSAVAVTVGRWVFAGG